MKILEFKEKKLHGSHGFPVESYNVNNRHPQYAMPCHWHDECELISVQKGAFEYMIDAQYGTALPGDLLFVNSGCLHEGVPRDAAYHCVVFSLDMLMKTGPAAADSIAPFAEGDSCVNLLLPRGDEELMNIVQRLFDAMQNAHEGYMLKTQGLLLQFFGVVAEKGYFAQNTRQDIGNQKKKRQLKKTLALIENSYGSPLTLEEMASAAGMSPKYFCHFFQQMTRRTPVDYLNHYRVEVARYRLVAGCHSVTDLAYECGFNDLSYFIRVFKRYVGTTPKQYAVMHAARLGRA